MKDNHINMRISTDVKEKFISRCENDLGRPYQIMLIEMIEAFNDGRLIIKQNPAQKDLYE